MPEKARRRDVVLLRAEARRRGLAAHVHVADRTGDGDRRVPIGPLTTTWSTWPSRRFHESAGEVEGPYIVRRAGRFMTVIVVRAAQAR